MNQNQMYYAENELAPIIEGQMPITKYDDDKAWGDVVTSAAFLPRVQLYGGNSSIVKEGKFPMGHFGLARSKEQIDDLGSSFECIPLSWRFKAMQIDGDTIISVYNPKAAEFLRIQSQSDVQDSGCMFGIEFLIWIPSLECFATYYLSSKTARRVAPNLKALLQKGALLKAELIKKGKFVWHGPVVTQFSGPIQNLPDSQEALDQANKFANPKESEVEAAEPVQSSRPQ